MRIDTRRPGAADATLLVQMAARHKSARIDEAQAGALLADPCVVG